VATLGRSREALRAGVFHLAFNVATAAVGLACVAPLARLARALGGDAARQIANAHVAFNVLGVVAALLVLGPAARALERLLPARPAGAAARGGRGAPPVGGPPAPGPEGVAAATRGRPGRPAA
jgi:phosphate:Na+ symporter